MCCATKSSPRRGIESGEATTAGLTFGSMMPAGAAPALAAAITVDGAALVELVSGGAVVQSTSTATAGAVAFHQQAALLPEYQIRVTATVGTVSVGIKWAVSQ